MASTISSQSSSRDIFNHNHSIDAEISPYNHDHQSPHISVCCQTKPESGSVVNFKYDLRYVATDQCIAPQDLINQESKIIFNKSPGSEGLVLAWLIDIVKRE